MIAGIILFCIGAFMASQNTKSKVAWPLIVVGLVLIVVPARGRDLGGRYAQSFEAKHALQRPSLVVPIMKRSLGNSELLTPVVEIFLNPTKRYFNAGVTILGLIDGRNPTAVFPTIIPIVVAPFDGKAWLVGWPHIFMEIGERLPPLAYLDASAAVPIIVRVFGIGAAGDHGKPYSDGRVAMLPRKAQQFTRNKTTSDAIFHLLSPARDDGRFANSPLHDWFNSLKSGKGPCCSDADGSAVSDVDWETKDGKYRVRLEGEWWDVPDDAVITEPNRAGRTMVWPIVYRGLGTALRIEIRCFLPGAMI